jgi:hypothetical protein
VVHEPTESLLEPSSTPAITSRRSPHHHTKDSAQTATDKPRGTTAAPVFVKILPTLPSKEQLDREARDREEKAANDRELVHWTEVLGKATVYLALATVALMVFTGINLLILRSQGRDLEKQRNVMQRQADHLEDQAVQLKATVAQMKDTAERQLRAYVFVDGAVISDPNSEKPIILVVAFKNSGQTPAYGYSFSVATQMVDYFPGLELPELQPRYGEGLQSRGDVPPGGLTQTTLAFGPIPPEDRPAMVDGIKAF